MEFSVKKFDLLEELNLTQGVVERKTTIPILSNILCEAKGNRLTITATDIFDVPAPPARRSRSARKAAVRRRSPGRA